MTTPDEGEATVGGWPPECDSLLARFEQAWREGAPGLEELSRLVAEYAPYPRLRRELLAELVRIDIEHRWRKAGGKLPGEPGTIATAENYLVCFPELASDGAVAAELAEEEYRARCRWGDVPTHQEFLARYPRLPVSFAERLSELDRELAAEDSPVGNVAEIETRHGHTWHSRAYQLRESALGATRSALVDFLWRVKPFSELPEHVVNALALEMGEKEFAAGEALVQQGAAASSLVVVAEGDVEVSIIDTQGRRRVIDRAGRGTVLGEMALVSNQPHSADVTAVSRVQALVLPVENLNRIARSFPPLGAGFAYLAAARLGRQDVDVLYDKRVAGFRVKRRLGQGGMAIVYEAEELASGARVALKMMRPQLAFDLVAYQRFHLEAATLARLRHENIVEVRGCFAERNTSFMVMELCEGPTLARLIDRSAPLAEPHVLAIVGQLAAALRHAHAAGIMHRDLKPGNVLCTWDGTLKLSDFGLARSFLSNGLTVQGEILGTPRYMPPEQLIGTNVDQRADLYALGCIAYELYFGSPPFTEPDVTRLLALQLGWSLEAALAETAAKLGAGFRAPGPELRRILAETLTVDRNHRTLNLEKVAALARPLDADLLWAAKLPR